MNERIEDILSRANCYEMVEENGIIWFSWLSANGLCQLDMTTNQVEILMRYVNEPIDGTALYSTIKKAGNVLVVGSADATLKVVLYNLDSRRSEYIDILPAKGNGNIKYTGKFDFWRSVLYGDNVYLLGYEYPAIVKINVVTKKVTYLTGWVSKVEERIEIPFYYKGYLVDYVEMGNFVYILCECAKVVLRLNLQTDEILMTDIKAGIDRFSGMCFDGENFWLVGYGNKVLKYDRQFSFIKQIEVPYEEERDGAVLFYAPLDIGDKIILFPSTAKHVYEIDKMTGEVIRNDFFDDCIKKQDIGLLGNTMLSPMKLGNTIRFITGADSLWNEYNCLSRSLVRYEVKTELNEELICKRTESISGKVIFEDVWSYELGYSITLSRFLQHLPYLPEKEEKSVQKVLSIGKKILQEVVNL